MLPTVSTEQRIGAIVGAATALLTVALAGAFLSSISSGPVGAMDPFASLTNERGLTPLQAATWTVIDAHGIRPKVVWDSGSITVIRGVFAVLETPTEDYRLLKVVPLGLLVCAGCLATILSRRFGTDQSTPSPVFGAYISLGYASVLSLLTWFATVPVTYLTEGDVHIGSTVTSAPDVAGVTAGPPIHWAIAVAIAFPIWFGGFGGVIVAACSRLRLPDSLRL